MSTPHLQWQKNQSVIWLVCGVACLLSAGIFWVLTESKVTQNAKEQPIQDVEVQIQPEKVAATAHLGEMVDVVKPLEDTTRIKIAEVHEAEFRGTKFIKDHKNDYTIELFRASKESVIKNFLRKQESRSPLMYIRLSGDGVQEQYVLLYGVFKNRSEAEANLSNNISLPKSIKPSVRKLGDFSSQVNDLGSDEAGVSNTLYAVRLSPAKMPVIDVAANQKFENRRDMATTTTTITQKDKEGNVVDVQKSQSNAQPDHESSKTQYIP